MNYEETLDYLYNSFPAYQNIGKSAYNAKLDKSYLLDEYFEQPHASYPCIHVAGTNGKGSVSHLLASVFQEAGYKTGLYTSPHLLDFRERIKTNGVEVATDWVVQFIQSNLAKFEEVKPSFFEMTVFMAFVYFKMQKVDVAIIETGLGGRLDSTNIISPVLSVITNIGMDHMQFLGNSLKSIAAEKAGIIKASTPTVIGEYDEETASVFLEHAQKKGSPITFASKNLHVDYSTISLDGCIIHHLSTPSLFELDAISTDLKGSYQSKNIVTALNCLQMSQETLPIKKEDLIRGFRQVVQNTGLLGRWQEVGLNPRRICDTGHNAEGIEEIVKQIEATPHQKLHLILGFVNDKDLPSLLKLFPDSAEYYFTNSSVQRSLDSEVILHAAQKIGKKGNAYVNVSEAYHAALQNSGNQDFIFIGGSTFVVADFLSLKKN